MKGFYLGLGLLVALLGSASAADLDYEYGYAPRPRAYYPPPPTRYVPAPPSQTYVVTRPDCNPYEYSEANYWCRNRQPVVIIQPQAVPGTVIREREVVRERETVVPPTQPYPVRPDFDYPPEVITGPR